MIDWNSSPKVTNRITRDSNALSPLEVEAHSIMDSSDHGVSSAEIVVREVIAQSARELGTYIALACSEKRSFVDFTSYAPTRDSTFYWKGGPKEIRAEELFKTPIVLHSGEYN